MKFVAFNDLHLHKFPYSKITEDGKNELFEAGLNILDQVYSYCAENDICYLFFIGDLFYHRHKIDTDVYCNETYNRIKKHQEAYPFIKLIFIPGNHDQISKSGKHCLTPFEGIQNVRVIHHNEILTIPPLNQKIFCCPYASDSFNLYGFLKDSTKDDIILMHQLIVNSPSLAGHLFKKDEAVDTSKLTFRVLFSGHNHRPFSRDGVYNIGAPMHHDFGDAPVLKRFFIEYDSDKKPLVTWIPTKFPIFATSDMKLPEGVIPSYLRRKIKDIVTSEEVSLDLIESDGLESILKSYMSFLNSLIGETEVKEDLFNFGLKLLEEE